MPCVQKRILSQPTFSFPIIDYCDQPIMPTKNLGLTIKEPTSLFAFGGVPVSALKKQLKKLSHPLLEKYSRKYSES